MFKLYIVFQYNAGMKFHEQPSSRDDRCKGYVQKSATGRRISSTIASQSCHLSTPGKINMEPINHPFGKEYHLPKLQDKLVF